MTRAGMYCAFVAILVAGCTSTTRGPSRQAESVEPIAQRQILVTVRQESNAALGLAGAPGTSYVRRRGYGAVPAVERILNRIAREQGLRRVRGWPIRSIGVYCEVYELGPGDDLNAVLARLGNDVDIELAQAVNTFETLATRYNDPYADLQTAVTSLSIVAAHAFSTGRGITVAIVDSQVDLHHPELRGRIESSRDLVERDVGRARAEIHGTAIAGVIASAANNMVGIVGIAPDVGIAALRACWAIGDGSGRARCSSFSLAQALEAAIDIGPDIINLSLAGPDDPLLGQLIDEALRRGVIVVAAMPDAANASASFPASHAGVIAALSETGVSGLEQPFVLVAPGREILTTIPDAGYAFFSGNSLAAAHVSGVAALLRESAHDIGPEEIVRLLNDTGSRIGTATSINVCRAVTRLLHSGDCTRPLEAIALEAK